MESRAKGKPRRSPALGDDGRAADAPQALAAKLLTLGLASPQRAKALAYAARRLDAFAGSLGPQPSAQGLLDAALIERFLLEGTTGLSPATVRTLASNLRCLERALAGERTPARLRLPRERAKPPYSQAEISAFLACACAQSTTARRMRAQALICLGAGAGVIGSELRHVRGVEVNHRSGGLIVEVAGARARCVPVLAAFHRPLAQSAAFAGEGYILGGEDPSRRNLSDRLVALFCDPALAPLQAGRLRSTWLSAVAAQIGLGAFMAAAGVSCSQHLGDIAASVPAMEEAQRVKLLGAAL